MTNQLDPRLGNLQTKFSPKEFAASDVNIDWPSGEPLEMTIAHIRVFYRLTKRTPYRRLVDRCDNWDLEPMFQMKRDEDATPMLSVNHECFVLVEAVSGHDLGYYPQSLFEELTEWWFSEILAGSDPVNNNATIERMRLE